jgi:hypothetical protein
MMVYIRTLKRSYQRVKQRIAARKMVRVARMWPLRAAYLKKTQATRQRKAATVMESACRAYLARKAYDERVQMVKEERAATVLTSLWRMNLTLRLTADLFAVKR